MTEAGRRIEVEGTVQGVGFRPWVYRLALEEGLVGRVRNGATGVTIEAFGSVDALDHFVARLQASPPRAATIRRLRCEPVAAQPLDRFEIAASTGADERRPSIPADLATCPACLAEILDPANRRFRYAFTNCTDCGPRFTVATGVPYDRSATTMARFAMCEPCRREYESPADRRFHAQPNACPTCGPRLSLLDAAGREIDSVDPLHEAAVALRQGLVVAVKGLGGFHLACVATSESSVARLRARKRREAKPFAVMVADLAAAHALARFDQDEADLLDGPERPIVLLPLRDGSPLAPSVAPGLDLVGLLLAYTPLHHLLLAEVGGPLVMTSGNLSEEPIAWRDADAVSRLGGIADLFLTHDRDVAAPCEDSVARWIAGALTLVRRSRGFVPRPIAVATPFAQPTLALGGDLKSVACLGVGESAWLTPHLGDLGAPESLDALEEAVERLQTFVGARAELVACDPHPGYFSRRLARELPVARRVEVQHHHAHVAACLAEHSLDGPALGLAFDGTGFGLDGTAWGGELLLADVAGFQRLATLRPLPLAGGETAVREVWRLALVALDDAYDGAPPLAALELFRAVGSDRVAAVRAQVAASVNAPLAHGAGRWFDAMGALLLAQPTARYEGEAALRLERLASTTATHEAPYPFVVHAGTPPWELDLRPVVRALVTGLVAGVPANVLAARFHRTLAEAAAQLVRRAIARLGELPVVLTGGCFQNALLTTALVERLGGLCLLRHRQVPPGDGGLALGQAVVAAAVAAGRTSAVAPLGGAALALPTLFDA